MRGRASSRVEVKQRGWAHSYDIMVSTIPLQHGRYFHDRKSATVLLCAIPFIPVFLSKSHRNLSTFLSLGSSRLGPGATQPVIGIPHTAQIN